MKKLIAIGLMTLTLTTATFMPAFAGMNNTMSEDFSDDLPEIEVEESEAPEESEEQDEETEAPAEETKDEKSEESEPEAKEEVVESHEETKATESEVPEKEIVIRNDNDNTPEHPTRVIYARRNVVICDNEPIESSVAEEVPETETKETVFEAPEEEETTVAETETVPVKVQTSSSLPKTADSSDLMIAGVAVMVIVATAFAVVANRRKRA